MTPTSASVRDRVRELAFVLPVAAAYVVLRGLGLIAHEPIWLYLLVLFASYGLSELASNLFPNDGTDLQTWARTGVQIACATVALYLTGWGAMLAIGYVALVADGVRGAGSRAARPLLVWSLLGLAAGQTAIALGLAPTMVATPKVHGLAVLAALALVPTVLLFTWATARREESEETATLLLDLAQSLAEPGTRLEVCRRIAEAVPGLVGVDLASVLLWDLDAGVLTLVAMAGDTDDSRTAMEGMAVRPSDTPALAEVIADPGPKVFRADDVDADAFIRDAQRAVGVVETIAVPITSAGHLLGVVSADRTREPARGLSPAVLARLEGLANQAAVALENARRLEQERAATDQLREADRLKSEFLAVVSHELRTPLSVMMGAARTLQWRGDGLETATRADLVESVVRRGEQLDRLVQDLLEASGDIKLEVAPVDLAAVVRMAVSDAAGLYPGAAIRCDANGDAVTVVADGFRVRQVVDNLLGNAAKYAPGAAIEVEVGCTDRQGWLCVADAGPGMTAAQVERAFDPFYQADSSAVRKVGGLGLGLHICRRIVHAHGGDIWIESQPGQGTRVKLSLPAEGPLSV